MLKTLAYSLGVAGLLLAAGAFSIAGSPDPLLPVRPYFVTSASAFPSIALPSRSFVFLNGLYQTPGQNYDVAGGAARFRAGVLSDGDRITVVSIAP